MAYLVTTAETIYARLGVLKRPPLRWMLALAYTIFMTVLLVQSSSHPVVGQAAPPGAPNFQREIYLTTGHIIGFFTLTLLWWWTLLPHFPTRRALFVAVGFALVFGVITELAQNFSADRSPSLFDLATNWVVTLVTARIILRLYHPSQADNQHPPV